MDFLNWNAFLFSQILALVAIIFDILSFRSDWKKKVLFFLALSAFLISMHFLFLEKYLTMWLYLFAVIRLIVGFLIDSKKNRVKMWLIFILIQTIIFISLYDEKLSFFPFIAQILSILATFQATDKEVRIWFMISTVIIIIYNAIVFSPMWILLETIFLTTNLFYFYKKFLCKKS